MNVPARLGMFGVGLALLFGAAAAVSGAAVPETVVSAWTQNARASHGQPEENSGSESFGAALPGLSIEEQGYRLSVVTAPGRVATPGVMAFQIIDVDGQALTEYAVSHDKQMHMIVVRSDGTQYRHEHPVMNPQGVWSLPWAWSAAGTYRIYADFVPEGRTKQPAVTLTRTVEVAGPYVPTPVAPPSSRAVVDGMEVTLTGNLSAGSVSELSARISRGGQPVTSVQPYLGAVGHLVALRQGDLAYLHAHPQGDIPAKGTPVEQMRFLVEAPTPGRYLLYLDFQVDGRVRTAHFAVDAASTRASTADHRTGVGEDHGDR
ncbi:hypothetical protein A5759_05485 [Mycobacterium sp. 852014-52144_SCH5372336]|nr:hypothetical protein A5759_05485 [Mycobacterium sp. 852014-52144_SCH5372336]